MRLPQYNYSMRWMVIVPRGPVVECIGVIQAAKTIASQYDRHAEFSFWVDVSIPRAQYMGCLDTLRVNRWKMAELTRNRMQVTSQLFRQLGGCSALLCSCPEAEPIDRAPVKTLVVGTLDRPLFPGTIAPPFEMTTPVDSPYVWEEKADRSAIFKAREHTHWEAKSTMTEAIAHWARALKLSVLVQKA